jgi:ATP adenylyltransferase
LISSANTQMVPINPNVQACKFCSLPSQEPSIIANEAAWVVPSLGSLMEGWLLVVPRDHYTALAAIEDSSQKDSFIDLAHEADDLVRRTYGPSTVWFEHGPAQEGKRAGCGVDHAHLHIVPTDVCLRTGAEDSEIGSELKWRRAEEVWDARDFHREGLDYLYVREVDDTVWLVGHPDIPGQLFRRVIARNIGEQGWDWKSSPRPSVAKKTYKRLGTKHNT